MAEPEPSGAETVARAAALIRELAGTPAPRLAIILGSGLGAVADTIAQPVTLPYAALPGFPVSTVAGHDNRLVLGRLGGLPVACLQGRSHPYEGAGFAAMAVPIRALRGAGITTLLITNAAGSLHQEIAPGRLMLIEDHINLQPGNPLTGPNDPAIGPRFPSLRDAYDPALRERMTSVARGLAIDLAAGIYIACAGPSFETPAEIRAFRMLGADAVGMSTVPETILARHAGLKVVALSLMTNYAAGMSHDKLGHEQTMAVAREAAGKVRGLLRAFLEGYE